MTDTHTKAQRSANMAAIKSRNTKPERLLASALWRLGLRFRRQNRRLAGSPDFAIQKYKLAVFVDGEFWHGKDWQNRHERIGTNREYWLGKIEGNINRDIRTNAALTQAGWTVLRYWAKDVEHNPDGIAQQIADVLSALKAAHNSRAVQSKNKP